MNSWIKATLFGPNGSEGEIWINMGRVIIMRRMNKYTELDFTSKEMHNVIETPEELLMRVALKHER